MTDQSRAGRTEYRHVCPVGAKRPNPRSLWREDGKKKELVSVDVRPGSTAGRLKRGH